MHHALAKGGVRGSSTASSQLPALQRGYAALWTNPVQAPGPAIARHCDGRGTFIFRVAVGALAMSGRAARWACG